MGIRCIECELDALVKRERFQLLYFIQYYFSGPRII